MNSYFSQTKLLTKDHRRTPLVSASNKTGAGKNGKNADFPPINCYISETIDINWYRIELWSQWHTTSKLYIIYRMVPISMTLNASNSDFKVRPLFDVERLRNGTRYRDRYNGILIGTYSCPSQKGHFKWPRVTAKYSMTRSTAWSLCDSWAPCS